MTLDFGIRGIQTLNTAVLVEDDAIVRDLYRSERIGEALVLHVEDFDRLRARNQRICADNSQSSILSTLCYQ